MVRTVLAIVAAVTALSSGEAAARDLLIAHGLDKPPFVFDSAHRGLEIDIMREALAYRGHTVRVVHIPNRRLQVAIQTAGVDGAASVRAAQDGNFYSDDFITFENVAISRRSARLTIRAVADLKGLAVVAWQNAYRDLGPEFEAAFGPAVKEPYVRKYYELPSQRSQNQMFWSGRADVIVVDKTIFLWYRRDLAKEMDTSAEVVFHDVFPRRTHYQAAFKDRAVRDDFNDGLRHLRATGRYDELYAAYLAGEGAGGDAR